MTEIADPERALALASAPSHVRPALSTLWRLDEQLGAAVARTDNPAAGQMRLVWWHDALRSLPNAAAVDPLLIELGRRPELDPEALLPLIDGWEALLDPLPLSDQALMLFADKRGSTLFQLTGRLLGSGGPALAEAGRRWALVDLAFRVSDRATADRALLLAPTATGALPKPLAVMDRLALGDLRRGLDRPRRQGSPGRVARAFLAAITGR